MSNSGRKQPNYVGCWRSSMNTYRNVMLTFVMSALWCHFLELPVASNSFFYSGKEILGCTWKYPLRGYILGVLTHTTTWDQHWGGDEILKWVLMHVAWLNLTYQRNVRSSASPCLMDPRVLRGDPECIISLLTHTKELLLITWHDCRKWN